MLSVFGVAFIIALSLIGLIRTQSGWGGSGIVATETPVLSTSTRRQTAAINLGKDGSKRGRSLSPLLGFPASELRDQNENAGTNRIAKSEGTARPRTVTPKMPETIAIRYVSKDGNDANDGFSWATAKHTIYGALVSLPGGGTNTAGSGTVYVGPASLANPTAGAGIWLMSPSDPNYASPPTGWLKCNGCSGQIIGIANQTGGPNGHKPRAFLVSGSSMNRNQPSIWLSGIQSPWTFTNLEIQYPMRGIVIGECSNKLRDGTCGVSAQVFENVSGEIVHSLSSGPCTDMASNVFWIWLRDYGCGGNAYNAKGGATADNAAAILIDGSAGSGSGLIYITDANLAGGGIKVKGGANSQSLYARNVIQEGDYVHPLPPTVWFTGWGSAGYDAVLDNIQEADASRNSMPNIEIDAKNVSGPTVLNSGGVQGPAVVINPVYSTNSTISPLRQGQTGFVNKSVVGETDVARRISGLVPVRFINHANSNPSSWGFPYNRGTITTGIADPFGGTNAASARSASPDSDPQTLQLGKCTPYTPALGDWIVVGIWGKNVGHGYTYPTAQCYGYPFPSVSTTYMNDAYLGDGQWNYQWSAYKVSGGLATYLNSSIWVRADKGPITIYGPTLYIIPAGMISDNEVLEFASSMNSVDSSCGVGQICNLAGHPVVVSSYGTLSNCSSVASPAKCDSAPAGSFVLSVGSATARVNTTAVTANSQILVIEDSSLGAKLGVSCNKTTGRTYMITDRAPGLSFAVSSSFAPIDHPACLSFQVLN